jgi:formate hydrogenlyase subunit 3/multisubunit Na+/H+ antiporter MnhD subunit
MQLLIVAPLAIGLLVIITWLALSKESAPPVRRAATAALVLIALSVIMSLVLIVNKPAAIIGPFIADPGSIPVEPEAEGSFSIIVFAILLLAFLALIIFLALRREQRETGSETPAKHSH